MAGEKTDQRFKLKNESVQNVSAVGQRRSDCVVFLRHSKVRCRGEALLVIIMGCTGGCHLLVENSLETV